LYSDILHVPVAPVAPTLTTVAPTPTTPANIPSATKRITSIATPETVQRKIKMSQVSTTTHLSTHSGKEKKKKVAKNKIPANKETKKKESKTKTKSKSKLKTPSTPIRTPTRFRRTNYEIEKGMTPEQAKEARFKITSKQPTSNKSKTPVSKTSTFGTAATLTATSEEKKTDKKPPRRFRRTKEEIAKGHTIEQAKEARRCEGLAFAARLTSRKKQRKKVGATAAAAAAAAAAVAQAVVVNR